MRTVLFEKEKKAFSKTDLINSFIKTLANTNVSDIGIEREELEEGYVYLNYDYGNYKMSMAIVNLNALENRNRGEAIEGETPEIEMVDGMRIPVLPKIYKYKILLGDFQKPNFSSDISINEFVKLKIMVKDKIKTIREKQFQENVRREEEFLRYSQSL